MPDDSKPIDIVVQLFQILISVSNIQILCGGGKGSYHCTVFFPVFFFKLIFNMHK